jgi:hypothetical protein
MATPEPANPESQGEPSAPVLGSNLSQPPGGSPPPSPSTVPSPPRRRWVWIAVVVVVLVAVVALLYWGGIFTPGSTAQNVVGSPSSFSQNEHSVGSAASNTSGGPWKLVAAVGINMTTSYSGPDLSSFGAGGSGCTFSPAQGAPASPTLPSTPRSAVPGTAAGWLFIAIAPSNDVMIYLYAQNTTSALFAGNPACGAEFSGAVSLTSTSVVDSTVVAASANADGGASFLAAHPGATELFIITGSSGAVGWVVEYTTCPLTATSGSGTQFEQGFEATSGVTIIGPSTTTVGC